MLDIGMPELLIVAIIAIIVVGPKDLPRALRTVMKGVKKARNIAREFQSGVDEMVREADLDDLKQELNKATDGDIKKTLTDAIDPGGDLAKDMDMKDVEKDLSSIASDVNEKANNKANKDVEDIIAKTRAESSSDDEPELINEPEQVNDIASEVSKIKTNIAKDS